MPWIHLPPMIVYVVLAAILAFTFYVILDFEYPPLGLIRIDDFNRLIADVRTTMG